LLRDLELLGDEYSDSGEVGRIDDRPFLGPEDTERLGTLQKRVQVRHWFHHLDAVLFGLETLVDLDEGHDPLVDQRLWSRLSANLTVHRPFEQDRSDHFSAAEARRADDA
jgi:hypothetical protein